MNDAIAESRRDQAVVRGAAGPIDPKTGLATGRSILGGPSIAATIYNNHERLIREQYQPRLTELDKIDAAPKPKSGKTDQLDAHNPPKERREKKAPEDKTVEFDKAAAGAEADARKAYAQALAALTTDIDQHAKLERDAVDADLAKKLTDIHAKQLEIDKAIKDGHADAHG